MLLPKRAATRLRLSFSRHKVIGAIALPAIVTNIATALFGLADIWAIGRLGDPQAQGGVEIGAKLLTTLCVLFNFLRSGTTALTAQAAGRQNTTQASHATALSEAQWQEAGLRHPANIKASYETEQTLIRAVSLALGLGLLLLLFKTFIIPFGLSLMNASGGIREQAASYLCLRYWIVPLILANMALSAWLIGMRSMRLVLAIEVASNFFHISMDCFFVLLLKQGVNGVAHASIISEIFSTLLLLAAVTRYASPQLLCRLSFHRLTWQKETIYSLFSLNRDLFIRTLLLMTAIIFFTRMSVQQGAILLAANAIINQLFSLATLILDGYESSAQILCGEAAGAKDHTRFSQLMRATLLQAFLVATLLALIYGFSGSLLVKSFTTDSIVAQAAGNLSIWLIILPLVGVSSYVMDGVFVGAGWSKAMMGSMAIALSLFMISLFFFKEWGNNGLWLSFSLFLFYRSIAQIIRLPFMGRRQFYDNKKFKTLK
ncbi:MAG: MATE family efflux transporter [Zymomonas sp.]|nr:MATE family efflux transporter [Zymomonas sp.]MCA1955731.1 MATE family efflux transporter [Zymomonas sp.]